MALKRSWKGFNFILFNQPKKIPDDQSNHLLELSFAAFYVCSECGSLETSISFSMDVMWMLQASRNSILFCYGRRRLDGIHSVEYIPIQSIFDLKDPYSPLAATRPFHWRHWPTDFLVGAIIMATKTCR